MGRNRALKLTKASVLARRDALRRGHADRFRIPPGRLEARGPADCGGAATVGPKGLLGVLETQLGLPTPTPYPGEAPFSYLQCLQEASSPDRFFHRSLEIDPVNVARTLLDWRDQWYEAGWDGTFPDDAPARLADMAAVEAIAKGRVPPTHGERLQRIAEALKERRTQVERVELHTPLDDLPHVWHRVIDALPWVPAAGLEPTVAGPEGIGSRARTDKTALDGQS